MRTLDPTPGMKTPDPTPGTPTCEPTRGTRISDPARAKTGDDPPRRLYFGRDLSSYRRAARSSFSHVRYITRCFRLFLHPLVFISAYVRSKPLPGGIVEFRDGMRIRLSDHPHDVVTVFVIFVREDYGDVKPGTTVVDIGANIGVFSLFAAHRGARSVHAYEPNSESYRLLLENIEANGLRAVIRAHHAAVVGAPEGPVRFPVASSAHNAILSEAAEGEFEWVDTVGMPAVLSASGPTDLLKLDCEGAEYDILFSIAPESADRVSHIRLEYHQGRVADLDHHLAGLGFVRRRITRDSDTLGSAWYERSP